MAEQTSKLFAKNCLIDEVQKLEIITKPRDIWMLMHVSLTL